MKDDATTSAQFIASSVAGKYCLQRLLEVFADVRHAHQSTLWHAYMQTLAHTIPLHFPIMSLLQVGSCTFPVDVSLSTSLAHLSYKQR